MTQAKKHISETYMCHGQNSSLLPYSSMVMASEGPYRFAGPPCDGRCVANLSWTHPAMLPYSLCHFLSRARQHAEVPVVFDLFNKIRFFQQKIDIKTLDCVFLLLLGIALGIDWHR